MTVFKKIYRRPRHHRGRFKTRIKALTTWRFLPNLFTLGTAVFGFASIIFAADGDFVASAYFILISALMDALDGRMARFAGTTSELGGQLDSLCDALAFCLAPAFLIYVWKLHFLGIVGFLACAAYLTAGVLRLAKFNLTSSDQSHYFLGVPVTICGCFLATFFLNFRHIGYASHHLLILLAMVVTLAYLMISPIRFPSFKYTNKNYYAAGFVTATAFFIIMGFSGMLFVLLSLYFLYAFCNTLSKKITR